MPEVDAIAIQCPSCQRRFRVKRSAIANRSNQAVKCPSCGGAIPIPSGAAAENATSRRVTELGIPGAARPGGPAAEDKDEELRDLLKKARRRKQSRSDEHEIARVRRPPPSAPDTQPDVDVSDATDPNMDATLPVGRLAHRAGDLARTAREQAGSPRPAPNPTARPRVDTPRAGARMVSVVTRHEPDEPTYTGPTPGRRPKITPTEKDLARFLVPGNYQVRVEDSVYAPVPHEALAELVDAGVMLGVNEMAGEDGVWTVIVAGGALGGLRERLSHRAHHMLARVATARPASELGRPPLNLLEQTGEIVALNATDPMASGTPLGPRTVEPTEAVAAASVSGAPRTKRNRVGAFALFVLTLAAGAALAVAFAPAQLEAALVRLGVREPVVETPAPVPELGPTAETVASVEPPPPPDPTPAFQSALAAVHSAAAFADTIDGMLDAARAVQDDKLVTTLEWMKWLRNPQGLDSRNLASRLMKRGDFQEARQIANWLIATHGENEELREIVSKSVKKQFENEAVVEIEPKRFERLVRVDTGHRPTLVLEDNEAQRWAFWPDLGEDAWRGDIAVYRLCQLMVCHFAVPETRAATIDKKAWRAVLKKTPADVQEMAKTLDGDFNWSKKGALNGSLRRLPVGAPWPIEATGIWRPWLTAGTGTSTLDDPADRAHYEVAFFGAEHAIAELEGLTARDLSRQIADVLLVDYLVGNWNRFAPNAEHWGTRTYIADGLIFSVNDSAAFLSEDSVRVRGRFSWASRFSRTTIESLRNLDPEEVEPLLFPDPSKDEKEKLSALWSQRKKALRRVDQLIKKYGAEDVFALDAPNTPTNP